MLKSLFVNNYVLIDQLDLDLDHGFHVFTGETGAGKSILVGALSLLMGNRADFSVIRQGQSQCELTAIFDISSNNEAQNWLQEQQLYNSDELELRRVINTEGKSKSWINSRPCSNNSLKQLSSSLVQIHGQHDQIKLNQSNYQLQIIDDSGDYQNQLKQVNQDYQNYKNIESELAELALAGALNESESQLLQYQFEELKDLDLSENELNELHQQQKSLTHAVDSIQSLESSIALLNNEESGNISHTIALIIQNLQNNKSLNFSDSLKMLDEVSINLNEVESDLQNKLESVEVNPQKLSQVELRLDTIYQTARKHKINPENLFQHFVDLGKKLSLNDSQKSQLEKLKSQKDKVVADYLNHSTLLSNSRKKHAKQFASQVTTLIQKLGLSKAEFIISVDHNTESAIKSNGQDEINFLVAMNPGQSAQKVSTTASGGELSRIALAIEICKTHNSNSSFIFDEVDAGIGGAVAETVGKLMRQLSQKQQVFAVTHLPQVAGLSNHHFFVSKAEKNGQTFSEVEKLNELQRIQELARMLGGSEITETTLQQAKAFILSK